MERKEIRSARAIRMKGLALYLRQLAKQGGLLTVEQRISTELEAAELAHRLLKKGKPVLFTNCGTEIPLVMNLYSSQELMLGTLYASSYEELEGKITAALDDLRRLTQGKFFSWSHWGESIRLLTQLRHARPRRIRGRGACQEVVHTEDVDLGILPLLKCWPHDGGAFVTLPMVITRDPETGAYNVGMYRMQRVDARTTGMHWHVHKTGASHFRKYLARGERMPVAVALGGDPLLAYCATAPLPEGISEWMLAGFLRERRVDLVKCLTQDLHVPAEADIVLEGYVDPKEPLFLEGPFGDHTGFYSLEDYYPYFHITAITHRRNAVYPATIVGVPPMEDAYIAEATERLFLPLLRDSLAPEIKDWWLPPEGVAHNLAVVSLQTSYAGQGERLAALLWSAGQMMFTKYVVLVDGTVNAHSAAQVLYAIAQHAHCRDRFLLSRGPVDALDHSAKESGVGAKLLINAMGASESTEAGLRWEALTIGSPGLALHVGDTFLAAVFAVPTQETIHWEALLESLRGAYQGQPRFAVLVDAKAPWRDPSRLMWSILANTDPSRDIGFHAIEGSGRLQLRVDARMKLKPSDSVQRWPNPVVSDSATQARIDALWAGLGLGSLIPSPSSQLQEFRFGEGAQARYEV